jgi:hypothetical protein
MISASVDRSHLAGYQPCAPVVVADGANDPGLSKHLRGPPVMSVEGSQLRDGVPELQRPPCADGITPSAINVNHCGVPCNHS